LIDCTVIPSEMSLSMLLVVVDVWLVQLWNTRHHPDDVRSSLQESLDRLKIKYLDLYLIHWPMSFKVHCLITVCCFCLLFIWLS